MHNSTDFLEKTVSVSFQKGTLHDELVRREARKDPFPELLLLNLFHQICDAVLYLHNLQPDPIAHRDLKPHNVLLDQDFSPVLMDLGKFCCVKGLAGPGAVMSSQGSNIGV